MFLHVSFSFYNAGEKSLCASHGLVYFTHINFCPFSLPLGVTVRAWLRLSKVYAFLMDLFVYFARVNFCPFSLPLGVIVRTWLRLVKCLCASRAFVCLV